MTVNKICRPRNHLKQGSYVNAQVIEQFYICMHFKPNYLGHNWDATTDGLVCCATGFIISWIYLCCILLYTWLTQFNKLLIVTVKTAHSSLLICCSLTCKIFQHLLVYLSHVRSSLVVRCFSLSVCQRWCWRSRLF